MGGLPYPLSLLEDINQVDLIIVDGPPGYACGYSRYPALPALAHKLSDQAEIWLDDAIRIDEKKITEIWAKDYNLDIEYIDLEKGLARLFKKDIKKENSLPPLSFQKNRKLNLNFSL